MSGFVDESSKYLHFDEHELAEQWNMREQASIKEERPE